LKVYIASRYSRRHEMQQYAQDLRADGYIVTSRWILGAHEASDALNDAERERFAKEDWDDLVGSQFLVTFSEDNTSIKDPGQCRGGRHVELGIALAIGMPVFLIGPRENIFHWLPRVRIFSNWQFARAAILDYEW